MDQSIIKEFKGSHPKVIKNWLQTGEGIYRVDPDYKPTARQRKHQFLIKLEKILGLDFSKKHYKPI